MAVKTSQSRLSRFLCTAVAKYYLRKPALGEFLSVKFPAPSSLAKAGLNELAFLLGLERSFFLTSLNLEVTNHCNLSCVMCPVNRSMKRPKGFMDFSLFRKAIQDTPTLESVLPFQWGESLLHPDIVEMVRFAVQRGLRVFLTSNGILLNQDLSIRLMDAGLTRMTFSVDGSAESHRRVRGYDLSRLKEKILRFRDWRDARGYNTKIDISMVLFEETEGCAEEFFEEWKGIADRVQAIPRFFSKPRKRKCRELWRGNLVVLYDGRVILCCADPEGVLEVGNAWETPLPKIWNGPVLRKWRKGHARGQMCGICCTCGEFESSHAPSRFS